MTSGSLRFSGSWSQHHEPLTQSWPSTVLTDALRVPARQSDVSDFDLKEGGQKQYDVVVQDEPHKSVVDRS